MSEGNVPAVRFRGFCGEWEGRKLGEVAIFSKGYGFSKSDLINKGYPIILYGRLYTKYETIISEVDTFIADNSNAIISKGNEVIVPASGETAEDISRASVVGKKGIALGGDLNIIYPNEDIISTFLAICISNGTQQREMMKRAQGKSVVHLRNSDLCEVKLTYPSKLEQTKIGEFSQNLDNLIAQNQKKYDKLVNMKKACLDKMFPKDGADIPEVRFKGFSEKWERIKITDVAYVFIGLVTTMTKFYRNEGVLLIRNSDIKDNRFEFSESPIYLEEAFASANANRKLLFGDVVTVHTGDVGTSAVVTKGEAGAIGFATINTRSNQAIIKPDYLATFFNSDLHKNYAIKMSTGDGRSNYNLRDFNQSIVPVTTLYEQTKIGTYFQTLDNLITLQKTKLEKLKNIKKACLDKMFI